MARSPLILALAAGLLIILSTVNILHGGLRPSDLFSWTHTSTTKQPLDLPPHSNHQDGGRPTSNDDRPRPPPLSPNNANGTQYLLGVGKADITGPVVEINFMGYADTAQLGTGLRQRLYSRAFIIGNASPSRRTDRFVYLVLDTQSGDTAVRHGILSALADMGGEYAELYGNQNVAVTGTHSHSGPGAWLNYLLPQITSKGFHRPSYQAIVDGAVASIVQAHQRMKLGRLSVGSVEVKEGNINRSLFAYLANPAEERKRYGEEDVEKQMTVLRFTRSPDDDGDGDGEKDVGILTWFPVHGTSMYGNNTLVTGDNKGVAAWMFEKSTDDEDFVAGFSQANVGDTSPNTEGAYCEYGDSAGLACDFQTSLCGNKTQPCHGRGPYWGLHDGGAASSYEIGRRQFSAARQLFSNTTAFTPVQGNAVKSLHHFVDFSHHTFTLPNGTAVRTCPAALGYSFAAGTTDGPGAFDFKQGNNNEHANPLWKAIGNRLHEANETQKACHGRKKILLDVGETSSPYEWSPNIVDVQLLRVGQMFIVVSPGEATTMAGRRWKAAVHDSASAIFGDDFAAAAEHEQAEETASAAAAVEPVVVLGGPANTYTHYITTPEEYAIQRYEGASTLYGPWTLDAYINLTLRYLPTLSATTPQSPPAVLHGPSPPIQINESLSFITPVVVDRPPFFKRFGAVKADVKAEYRPGDTVAATFVGANPRNDFRLGGTFAAVETFDFADKVWREVRSDEDWSLVFEWKRTSEVLGTSEVTISWETAWETGAWRDGRAAAAATDDAHDDLMTRHGVGDEVEELRGLYRLRYYGDAKAIGGSLTAFEGVSGEFRII